MDDEILEAMNDYILSVDIALGKARDLLLRSMDDEVHFSFWQKMIDSLEVKRKYKLSERTRYERNT